MEIINLILNRIELFVSNLCHAANLLLWLFEISDIKGWLRFSYDLQFIPRRSRREKGYVLRDQFSSTVALRRK